MITDRNGNRVCADSTGKPIAVGDVVRFRGREYTIAAIVPNGSSFPGVCAIRFTEPQHTSEIADEISVDLVRRGEG